MSSGNDQRGHHSNKRWVPKLSRSRSSSSVPTAPKSPRSRFADGVDLQPPSPPSPRTASATTPPKKSWEKHYKSFLRGRFFPERSSPPDLTAPSKSPSGKKILFGKRQPQDRSRLQQPDLESDHVQPIVALPDLPSRNRQSSSKGFLQPASKTAHGDTAVRAGSLFHQFSFKRERAHSGPSPLTNEDASVGSHGSGDGLRRKLKSVDSALDTTVRRGHDVAYSPGNARKARFARKTGTPPSDGDDLDTAIRKGQSVAYSPGNSRFSPNFDGAPPAPFLSSDLEGTVRGGVLQRSVGGPVALPESLKKSDQSRDSSIRSSNKSLSKEIKVAFTSFHNSAEYAQDSTSAYLGDEPSQHKNDHFAGLYSQRNVGESIIPSRYSEGNFGLALSTVTEGVVASKTSRVLCPLMGSETWTSGRRYLIAPATMVMFPRQLLPILSKTSRELKDIVPQSENETVPRQNPWNVAFESLLLGAATVTYLRSTKNPYEWSTCLFVLRQNYLLEYCEQENVEIQLLPRGFAHLQYSQCRPHGDFHDSLILDFYASPCARADRRKLMIRVKSRQERDLWVEALTKAATLEVESLYNYDRSIKFGDGRYATVYPAKRRKVSEDGTTREYDCAIKVVNKQEFWYRVQNGRERSDTVVREVGVQSTLSIQCGRLPTFVKMQGFFETCDNIVIETELLEGTVSDLFQYVSKRGILEEAEAAHIMRDLLSSLEAMRRIGVAHRDVKPANILTYHKTHQNHNGVSVKLADYGMSTFVGIDGLIRGRCGTPGFAAPEIFEEQARRVGYGNSVDVFSAGVTLYVMLCGYEPFYGESDAELIAANREANLEFEPGDWEHVSPEAINLIERMLERSPEKRISAREALNHSWIVNRAPTAPWTDLSKFIDRLALDPAEVSVDSACTVS